MGELAAQEAPELAAVSGGVCPSCNREHGDTDRHCVHCGVQLRRACPSCDKPLKDAQQFCPECGAQAPTGHVKPSDGPRAIVARELPEDATPTPAQRWDGDDMFWVAAGVDVALIQLGGDICDNDQRERINSRAADVANKHLRIGGKWKEEIKLGMAIAGVLFPALYTHFVIAPRAKRAELAARAQAAQAAQAPQPNGDQAQTTTSLRSV